MRGNQFQIFAMELEFQTKEESNRQQEEAFLKLSESEKGRRIFKLKELWKILPIKKDFLE